MTLFGRDLKLRVSYAKKIANDYKRMKDIMDVYDFWYGDYRDPDLIDKYKINYDLYNGRLDVSLYDEPVCFNIDGKEIKFDYNVITHYPLISQVAQAMYGEMIARPFKPMAKDLGPSAQTLRDKKLNELTRQMLEADVIQPIRGELTKMFLQQQGLTDILKMTPEALQQMEMMIDQQVQAKTPEAILEFMDSDFKTPTLRQAQKLLDYFVNHLRIKNVQEEGFKHAIITGLEVYQISDENGEPTLKLCNPLYVTWGGSKDTEWVQDATWVKYETWLTLEEATQKYAEYLKTKDYKALEGYLEIIPDRARTDDYKRDPLQQRVMYELSIEDNMILQKFGDPSYKTKDGQNQIKKIYEAVAKKYGMDSYNPSIFGIRETHFCWRDKTKMYRVKRLVENEEKVFWEDEHYTPKPEDIEVKEVWVDEIWEGTKLGSTGVNDIYVRIRPVPHSTKSAFNPYGVKLPYVGKTYNTHMNNSKNVSIVDLGKSWQKEFDTTMAQIKRDMATDFGNVFMMSLSWKPDNMEWQQWFDIIRNGNLLITNWQKQGFNQLDPNLLRSVYMGKAADIAAKFQYAQGVRGELVRAMNFNDYRIGSIGQYATNNNTEQAQNASYNQTEGYFETHRLIVEHALNMFMNRAKAVYRNNEKLKYILDDVSRTELQISPEFWYEEWAIEFTTSTEEIMKVRELRQQMLSFVQNGMSFDGILALSLATTPTDIIDIMKREQKRLDKMRQEQMQMQQQQLEAELQAQAKDKEEERNIKYQMHRETLDSQTHRTMLDREKFQMQADADSDGRADILEKTEMELKVKDLIEKRKIELEYARLGLEAKAQKDDKDFNDEKITVEKIKARSQAKSKKKAK